MKCNHCGAELQEDSTFCYYCGYDTENALPKPPAIPGTEIEEETFSQPPVTIGIVIWMVIIIAGNLISYFQSIDELMSYMPTLGQISTITTFGRIGGAAGILMKYRAGFYILAASVVIDFFAVMIIAHSFIGIGGFIGLAIIYWLLTKERDNYDCSIWDAMK